MQLNFCTPLVRNLRKCPGALYAQKLLTYLKTETKTYERFTV